MCIRKARAGVYRQSWGSPIGSRARDICVQPAQSGMFVSFVSSRKERHEWYDAEAQTEAEESGMTRASGRAQARLAGTGGKQYAKAGGTHGGMGCRYGWQVREAGYPNR